DVVDTNGAWLAHRLERLGVSVSIMAALPDDIDVVARFIRDEAPDVDFVLVTGGLGGTPDDLTREALAAAFGVGQAEVAELATADVRDARERDRADSRRGGGAVPRRTDRLVFELRGRAPRGGRRQDSRSGRARGSLVVDRVRTGPRNPPLESDAWPSLHRIA